MIESPVLIFDPYLLSFSENEVTVEFALKYVTRLLAWERCLAESEVRFVFLSEHLVALQDDGHYPFTDKLELIKQKFLRDAQALPFDVVYRIINKILGAVVDMVELTSVQEYTCEEECSQPLYFFERLGSNTRRVSEYLSASLAISGTALDASFVMRSIATGDLELSGEDLRTNLSQCIAVLNDGSISELGDFESRICLFENDLHALLYLGCPVNDLDVHSDLEAVLKYCERKCSILEILESAHSSAAESPYRFPSRVARALAALDSVYGQKFDEALGCDLKSAFRHYGLDYSSWQSESALGKHSSEYQAIYRGKLVNIQPHLKLGGGFDPQNCLRIYFYVDEENKKVAVAHVGRHKPTQ